MEAMFGASFGADIMAPPLVDVELAKSLTLEVPRAYLWERCVELVDRTCILVDLSVLWTRSVAQIVVGLMGASPLHWIRGVPVPKTHEDCAQEWVDKRLQEALEDLTLEDEEAYLQGLPQPDPEEPRHLDLTQFFGVDPDAVLAAAVRFNRLEFEPRQAFFAVFIEQRDLQECEQEGMGSPSEVKKLAEAALKTLLTPDDPYAGQSMEDLL